ncbi:hypothetical protein [Geopsychrobacter electrodiphilus]|uniref:hypothetical protein n=1 Tax=Geopsychrobacter electrodiphilus TaxID=225196 RepID=UPI00036FB4F1|nr:hypothetical protein [Geopsychrobacter electrodiphilus]
MILHPGVLALLVGGLVSLLMLSYGALLGLQVARRWNPEGAEAEQLELERRSWLVAVLVRWAIIFEALSLLLFIYTVEVIHPMFVGAMCATGTLNANPIGWHLIWIKLLLFLLGSFWMVVNHLDLQLPSAPLTRLKFLALLPLLPLVYADLYLTCSYFFGLEPEVITSCCGALFSSGGSGLAAEMTSFPLRPMIIIFYLVSVLFALLLLVCRYASWRGWRTLLALNALAFGAVALASVVSFISVYYYQLPSHHCPFDLLQGHYYFIGYPLYFCLFGALLCGLIPQLLFLLKREVASDQLIASTERHWLNAGLILLAGMLTLVSWPMLFSSFTLKAYF